MIPRQTEQPQSARDDVEGAKSNLIVNTACGFPLVVHCDLILYVTAVTPWPSGSTA
jgi:hypothetical protein